MRRTYVLLALLLASCRTQEKAVVELETRLASETARLEAQLKAIDAKQLPDDVAGLTKGFGDSFASVRAAKSPTARLYRLRDTFIGVETIAFFAANPKAGEDMDSLRALVDHRRAAFEAKLDAPAGPVLYRALVEQAANRARVLYRASAPYGKISDPMWGGLYYLGQAEGNLKFRDFVASLPKDIGTDDEPRADHQQLATAADQLQRETLAVFEKDPSGRGSIRASAKLKEAKELLAANLDDGAALALVEARQDLSRPKADADIPALLQSYVRERIAPMKVAAAAATGPVTVTLVRWPYT